MPGHTLLHDTVAGKGCLRPKRDLIVLAEGAYLLSASVKPSISSIVKAAPSKGLAL